MGEGWSWHPVMGPLLPGPLDAGAWPRPVSDHWTTELGRKAEPFSWVEHSGFGRGQRQVVMHPMHPENRANAPGGVCAHIHDAPTGQQKVLPAPTHVL